MPLPFEKHLTVENRYLLIPVKNENPKVVMQLARDAQMVREFDVELALEGEPDWWAFYDISQFQGQTLALRVVEGEVDGQAQAWLSGAIQQAEAPVGMEDLYLEPFRPQLHFTARRGWNNDPNGLVYQAGEWHMFYQHNPFGVRWGNMHWGHAISTDLVHWQELPEALYQRSLSDMAYSGGGLIDHENATGFQTGGEPPMVLEFTSTGRGECIAFSNDRGRTITEYEGNPVLKHVGRDPKIIRYGSKWVMVVYEELGEERGYAFYDSTDLRSWNRLSFLPGFFECPELFELPIDGDPARKKWVLYGALWQKSRSTCLIGSFDGHTFATEESNYLSHFGPHFYASQIFSDAPDGRVIMISWLAGPLYPNSAFSQGMTVPLELMLRSTPAGARLCYTPVRELETLREATLTGEGLSVEAANEMLSRADAELLDVELEIRSVGDEPVTLDVRGHPLTYLPALRELRFAGATGLLPGGADSVRLRVLVDRSVIEVFVDDGMAAFSAITLFEEPDRPLKLDGQMQVDALRVHRLRSIWE